MRSTKNKRLKKIAVLSNDGEKNHFACKECGKNFSKSTRLNSHVSKVHSKKRHVCEECGVEFRYEGKLKEHQRYKHDGAGTCPQCQKILTSQNELERHIKYVHLKMKNVKCDLCEYACTSSADMEKHVNHIHLKNMHQHPCDECPHVATTKYHLREHKLRHSGVKDAQCQVCKKAFTTAKDARIHQDSVHQKIDFKKFQCSICDTRCSKKGALTAHFNLKHGDQSSFVCQTCGTTCSSKGNLERHVNTVHLKIKPFKCKECEFSTTHGTHLYNHNKKHKKCCNSNFASLSELRQHEERVHLKKRFSCDECDLTFTMRDSLKRHKNVVHYNIRPHVCSDCPYAGSTKTELKSHRMYRHGGVKNVPCPECSKVFMNKKLLKTHFKHVHEKVEYKKFECSICEKRFSRKMGLQIHIRYKHEEHDAFVCQVCGLACPTKGSLERHVKWVHLKMKPFKCEECDFRSENRTTLRNHSNLHKRKREIEREFPPVYLWLKCHESELVMMDNSAGCHLPLL